MAYNFLELIPKQRPRTRHLTHSTIGICTDHLNSTDRDTNYTDTVYLTTRDGYWNGFNGMERDFEWNMQGEFYDFGARIYDSSVGRWLIVNLLSDQYPYITPFAFILNSLLFIIDPNGNWVIVKDEESKRALLNTLSEDELSYIRINKNGRVKVKLFAPKGGGSFQALRKMSRSRQRFAVMYSNKYESAAGEQNFNNVAVGRTVTLDKRLPASIRSADKNVYVLIAKYNKNEKGQMEVFAHEFYDHGFLYLLWKIGEKDLKYDHDYKRNPDGTIYRDTNGNRVELITRLKKHTLKRMKETRKNFATKKEAKKGRRN